MRYMTTLICIVLCMFALGNAFAAEESASTRLDTPAAETAATACDRPEPLPFSLFKVSCPERGAPSANLLFELPQPQHVILQIYDEAGQLVRGLLDEERPAGFQTIAWNGCDQSGKNLGEGPYYALLGVAGQYDVRTMSLAPRNSR